MTPTEDAVFVREPLGCAAAVPLRARAGEPAVGQPARALAGVGTALAAAVASQTVGAALRVHLAALETPVAPDTAVAIAVLGGGLLVSLWYVATAVAALIALALRRDLGVARWGAPLARRLALGAGLGLLAVVPAQAQTPDDLSWGAASPSTVVTSAPPLATAVLRPAGPLLAVVPAPPAGSGPDGSTAPPDDAGRLQSTHVVVAGECLWAIAAEDVAPAPDSVIAGRVAAYVAANPGLDDPDLIHPGDALVVPSYPEETR